MILKNVILGLSNLLILNICNFIFVYFFFNFFCFLKMKNFEKKNENESIKLFNDLKQMNLDKKSNIIDYEIIRKILSINYNKDNEKNILFYKIASSYNFVNAIKDRNFNKNSYNNELFNEQDFINFVTGKNFKNLLFENDNINEKRFEVENYSMLYELLGGDKDGIKKEDIKSCIEEVYFALNNSKIPKKKLEKEIDEIMNYLSTDGENKLSMKDFLNIMTCNTPLPKDNDSII